MSTKPERVRVPLLEGSMTAAGRETYHVEDGSLPCWCDLDRDHTSAEFFAWLDAQPEA